tara:strand:- start:488 stop:955 length:468 start_codon:yes stop_codon:yes gene_type:complete
MLPITELRLSIPYFIIYEKIDTLNAVLFSIIGNICIGLLVFNIISPIMYKIRNFYLLSKPINYIINRTKTRSSLIDNFKALGLIVFIGIPLPFTGVWTGSLAAYLFGVTRKRAMLAIVLGVLMSATIVTLLTIIANEFWFNIINDQINKKLGIVK